MPIGFIPTRVLLIGVSLASSFSATACAAAPATETATTAQAGPTSVQIEFPGGRIAISSDGNLRDKDDFAGTAWTAVAAQAALRPNVLFFAIDDLRPELGCYGAKPILSPNLDRLAARGILFERAYAQQAVCNASRASLMTGLRPDTIKVWDLATHFRKTTPGVVTLPELFKRHGWHTEAMGKIYHQTLDDPASWSGEDWQKEGGDWLTIITGRQPMWPYYDANGKPRSATRAERGPAWAMLDLPDSATPDGKIADRAVERLRALKDSAQPFFLAVGFHKPHLPFVCPKEYFDLYPPDSIALPDNFYPARGSPDFALNDSGELRSYDGTPRAGPTTEAQTRELRRAYYACVSQVDALVGRVVGELDRLGLAANTLIVLYGDHGWKLGEHGGWAKHTNVENDTHSPLIIVDPRRPGGRRTAALVEFVDIFPTLCELSGLPPPAKLDGTSLVPLFDSPARPWKPAAFSQYPRSPGGKKLMGYTMRTDRHRYTRWVTHDAARQIVAEELYDHATDPEENENVRAAPGQASALAALSHQMDAFLADRPQT